MKYKKYHPRVGGDRAKLIPAFAGMTLVLVFAATVFAAESSLFDQANAKYQAGDFKAASEIYQRSIQAGQATAAIHYNLGNAALRSGEKGQALVYFERALKASPRDEDLRWNLRVLKEALPDRIDDDSYFAIAAARDLLGWLTTDELAVLLSALLFIAVLLNGASIFSPVFKAWTSWFRTFGIFIFIVTAALFAWKVWETKDPRIVILDKETYAYYGPSEVETKAFLLHEGASGKITDATNDWVFLTLLNKKSGWIRKNSCETI